MRWVFILIVALWGSIAGAGERLDAEAFDALTQGKTFYYGEGGQPYGAEEYLDNRRVRWSFLDGQCKEGHWYEADGMICFAYEDAPEPHCWVFEQGARGLIARFMGETGATELYEMQQTRQPLRCKGPEVGV